MAGLWFFFTMVMIALVLLCVPVVYFLIISAIADRAGGVRKSPGLGGFQILPAKPDMPLRFAILHHTGVPSPHFDLMFETAAGSALATWRSPVWPIVQATAVERLDDHRHDYLDYEGPVSNDRGEVRSVAGGEFHFESRSDDRWVIVTDQLLRLSFTRRDQTAIWLAEVGQTA
jgi:hypothetical protein